MTEREKVIKGLMCIAGDVVFCAHCKYSDVNGSGRGDRCKRDCAKDALALLKAPEPRVLTLEEAKSVEGYVWLECCDTPILRVSLFHDGYYIEPFEEPFRVDLMNWPDYNKEWRYWTSCPTDAQREATPWERLN